MNNSSILNHNNPNTRNDVGLSQPHQFTSSGPSPELVLLKQLHHDMMTFANSMTTRVMALESDVGRIWKAIEAKQNSSIHPSTYSKHINNTLTEPTSASPSSDSNQILHSDQTTSLLVGPMSERGFIKTPFPDWEIMLVDNQKRLITQDGYRISLRLVSPSLLYLDNCLSNPGSLMEIPLINGKACISGLKFLEVSSHHGEGYQFEISVRSSPPNSPVPGTILTPKFQILSERLKHEIKASQISELEPDANLIRAPGIGKKYAAKLADLGIHTVRDLAAIDEDPATSSSVTMEQRRQQRMNLLNSVRKERGALTEAKLAELIRGAKLSVADFDAKKNKVATKATTTLSSSSSPSARVLAVRPPSTTTTSSTSVTSTSTSSAPTYTTGVKRSYDRMEMQDSCPFPRSDVSPPSSPVFIGTSNPFYFADSSSSLVNSTIDQPSCGKRHCGALDLDDLDEINSMVNPSGIEMLGGWS